MPASASVRKGGFHTCPLPTSFCQIVRSQEEIEMRLNVKISCQGHKYTTYQDTLTIAVLVAPIWSLHALKLYKTLSLSYSRVLSAGA